MMKNRRYDASYRLFFIRRAKSAAPASSGATSTMHSRPSEASYSRAKAS